MEPLINQKETCSSQQAFCCLQRAGDFKLDNGIGIFQAIGHHQPKSQALSAMRRQLYRQAQSAFQRGEDENMAKICEAYMLAQEAARTMEEQEAEGWNCLAFPSSFWPSTWFEGTMQACGFLFIIHWVSFT
jgi:hypothetical protein